MTDNNYEYNAHKLTRISNYHAMCGARIYRGGWPIEQCENEDQRRGYMDALNAEADAETEHFLALRQAQQPQAVAA